MQELQLLHCLGAAAAAHMSGIQWPVLMVRTGKEKRRMEHGGGGSEQKNSIHIHFLYCLVTKIYLLTH